MTTGGASEAIDTQLRPSALAVYRALSTLRKSESASSPGIEAATPMLTVVRMSAGRASTSTRRRSATNSVHDSRLIPRGECRAGGRGCAEPRKAREIEEHHSLDADEEQPDALCRARAGPDAEDAQHRDQTAHEIGREERDASAPIDTPWRCNAIAARL